MSRAKAKAERITLHDEVVAVLKSNRKPMTTTALATAVVERGRYRKRDGSAFKAGELWPLTIWQLAEKSADLRRRATTVTLTRQERRAKS